MGVSASSCSFPPGAVVWDLPWSLTDLMLQFLCVLCAPVALILEIVCCIPPSITICLCN